MLAKLMSVWSAGDTAGVATVVRTFRSAPRPPGASMVVAPDGSVSGSVSGGCVEGAVYELAIDVAQTGAARLQRYGISDDDAFAVGLTCGGIIDVFVESMSRATFPELGAVADDVAEHRAVAIATVIAHSDSQWVGRRLVVRPDGTAGSLGSDRADAAVTDDARGLLALGRSEVLRYGPDGQRLDEGMEVFVSSYAPRPRMLVFGAIDFAAALAQQGSFLGYRVTVCDARPVFATAAALSHRRQRRRRLAAPISRRAGRGGRYRQDHGDLRAHPRSEVRRPGARGGTAPARSRIRGRDGDLAGPTTTG